MNVYPINGVPMISTENNPEQPPTAGVVYGQPVSSPSTGAIPTKVPTPIQRMQQQPLPVQKIQPVSYMRSIPMQPIVHRSPMQPHMRQMQPTMMHHSMQPHSSTQHVSSNIQHMPEVAATSSIWTGKNACEVCKINDDPRTMFACNTCKQSYHYVCQDQRPGGVIRNCKSCTASQQSQQASRSSRSQLMMERRNEAQRLKQLEKEEIDRKKQEKRDEQAARDQLKKEESNQKKVKAVRKKLVDDIHREQNKMKLKEENEKKQLKIKLRKEKVRISAVIKKLRDKHFPFEDIELQYEDSTSEVGAPPVPFPVTNVFGSFPHVEFGNLVMIWDTLNNFKDFFEINPFTLEDLRYALGYQKQCTLMYEIHNALLRPLVNEYNLGGIERENKNFSNDGSEDPNFKSRNLLGASRIDLLTWQYTVPLLTSYDEYFGENLSEVAKEAIDELAMKPHPLLSIAQKISILRALIDALFDTHVMRELLVKTQEDRAKILKQKYQIEKEEEIEAKKIRAEEYSRYKAKKAQEEKEAAEAEKKKQEEEEGNTNNDDNDNAGTESETVVDDSNASVNSSSVRKEKLSGLTMEDIDDMELSDHDSDDDTIEDLTDEEIIERKKKREERQTKLNVKLSELRHQVEKEERQQRWEAIAKEKQELAIKEINRCVKANDLLGLKEALQQGRDAHLETGRGDRKWKAPEMEQGYSELERLEEEEEREKERQQALQRRRKRDEQFEKELVTFSTRTEPLGKDRNFNRYWYFPNDPHRLYVELRDLNTTGVKHIETHASHDEMSLEYISNLVRTSLSASINNPSHRWMYYPTIDDVYEIISSLDERGVRESELKSNLESLLPKLEKQLAKRPKIIPASPDTNTTSFTGLINEDKMEVEEEEDAESEKTDDECVDTIGGVKDTLSFLAYSPLHLDYKIVDTKSDDMILAEKILKVEEDCNGQLSTGAVWTSRAKKNWRSEVTKVAGDVEEFKKLLLSFEEVCHSHLQPNDKLTSVTATSSTTQDMEVENNVNEEEEEDEYEGASVWDTRELRADWREKVSDSTTISSLAFTIDTLTDQLILCEIFDNKIEKTSSKLSSERLTRANRRGRNIPVDTPSVELDVCRMCGDGGELMICDGDCGFQAHCVCVGLKKPPTLDWYCEGCNEEKTDSDEDFDYYDRIRMKQSKKKKARSSKKQVSPHKVPAILAEDVCKICQNDGELLLCDDCDQGYHIKCMGMKRNPTSDTWYCPTCTDSK